MSAVDVKINVALPIVPARVETEPRIVNSCPRRFRTVADCAIRRENSAAPFLTERSIVAADNRRAVIIRAAAQSAPIFHVVEPKIIFVTRNFDLNGNFGRVVVVSKIHRANVQVDIIRHENFRDSVGDHFVDGCTLLRDAHNLCGVVAADLRQSFLGFGRFKIVKSAHFFLLNVVESFAHVVHRVESFSLLRSQRVKIVRRISRNGQSVADNFAGSVEQRRNWNRIARGIFDVAAYRVRD